MDLEAAREAVEHAGTLDELRLLCLDCRRCGLAAARQFVVFGEGDSQAQIFLLGEAPGAREDESGRPFVGRAGEVLTRLLTGAGLKRRDLFITGSVKCRPPRNRNPQHGELTSCRPFLDRQLALIRPRVVVCLGLVATRQILGPGARLADLRGRLFDGRGYRVLPTYHPAAVLRGVAGEALLAEDLLTAAGALR
jgi:uracil-DNA glycosylase